MNILLAQKARENLLKIPEAEQGLFSRTIRKLASKELSGIEAWGMPGVFIHETAWGGKIVFRKNQTRTVILGIWQSLQAPRTRVNTSALVLAAGKPSSLQESSLSEMVLALMNGGIDDIIVVLSPPEESIREMLAGKPVKIVYNPDYERGLSQSIRCGLKTLAPDCGAVFLTLGNRPLIKAELVTSLIRNYKIENKPILVPTFASKPGHPVIFSPSLVPELMRLKGNAGGRILLHHHRDELTQLEIGDQSITTGLISHPRQNKQQ